MIQVGELVEKAGLLKLDELTLLGALLSNAATLAADPDARARWAAEGERALCNGPTENEVKEALTITFPTPLGRAFSAMMRAAGLRFNRTSRMWEGRAYFGRATELARICGGTVHRDSDTEQPPRDDLAAAAE